FTFYGLNNWMPSFLARIHHLPPKEISLWLSLIVGISGIAGSFIGGKVADRFCLNNVKNYCLLPALVNLVSLPFTLLVLFSPSSTVVLIAYIVPSVFNVMFVGTAFALIYRLIDVRLKALAAAFFLLIANLLGVSFGPLTIGAISDLIIPLAGTSS